MKNELNRLGKIKQGLHFVQALVIFVAWALTVAVLTKKGQTGAATYYYFALCFFSVPALIYQVCVPVFPRARRFANPYAYAVIDAAYTILWLAAYIAVSIWDNAGINQGKSDNKDSDGTCTYWAYGDSQRCLISKSSVGLGVVVWLLFGGTLAISVLYCRSYRQGDAVPGLVDRPAGFRPVDDASKDVWSTNIEEQHDEEMDDRHKYGQVSDDDEQELLHKGSSYNMHIPEPHPGAPVVYQSTSDPRSPQYIAPSALSPRGAEDAEFQDRYQPFQPPPRPEQTSYPPARYDRI